MYCTYFQCSADDICSPHHPLAESTGTHTYIVFAFKKKTGVYLTAYYNPQVYARPKAGNIIMGSKL